MRIDWPVVALIVALVVVVFAWKWSLVLIVALMIVVVKTWNWVDRRGR